MLQPIHNQPRLKGDRAPPQRAGMHDARSQESNKGEALKHQAHGIQGGSSVPGGRYSRGSPVGGGRGPPRPGAGASAPGPVRPKIHRGGAGTGTRPGGGGGQGAEENGRVSRTPMMELRADLHWVG